MPTCGGMTDGLTLEKLIKAKAILDANPIATKDRRMVFSMKAARLHGASPLHIQNMLRSGVWVKIEKLPA